VCGGAEIISEQVNTSNVLQVSSGRILQLQDGAFDAGRNALCVFLLHRTHLIIVPCLLFCIALFTVLLYHGYPRKCHLSKCYESALKLSRDVNNAMILNKGLYDDKRT
jgi:hypothetical protein